ncbi:uncharacterized protein LOC127837104 [Dreissena polymorpha]|nr:uncharacterized protein LOC127837104 [Dreissena polymorpha]
MYKVIYMRCLKGDANLDGIITQAEFSAVFQAFDKNGDGAVTRDEYVDGWVALTKQTRDVANAYFHVADLNHDNVIDQDDYAGMYTLFDQNGDGALTFQECVQEAENVVRATPFSELFEKSDRNKDEFLTKAEFRTFFQSFDNDDDSRIDTRECDAGWALLDYARKWDADSLFRCIDTNGDRYITEAEMDKLFGQYDKNADDKLDLQEVKLMKGLLVKPKYTSH